MTEDRLIQDGGGDIARLLAIMVRLRDPERGCPWDVKQTSASIAHYAIEEAHELVDAIQRDDAEDMRDELGDLLLQVVFHAQMNAEAGRFEFADIVRAISDKMVRRHPHVFEGADPDQAHARWEEIKAAERAAKRARAGGAERRESVLDGVPKAQPALMRAQALKRRAARVGFDWPDATSVLDKVREEAEETAAEYATGASKAKVREEFGDLAFVLAILGDHLGVDAESALRDACDKFERRFRAIETRLDIDPANPPDLERMEAEWSAVKAEER